MVGVTLRLRVRWLATWRFLVFCTFRGQLGSGSRCGDEVRSFT